MKKIIAILILCVLFIGCKNEDKPSTAPNKSMSSKSTAPNKISGIGAMPQDIMQKLYEDVTYVDYIFHELPFSVSQDNKASVVANIRQISPEALDYLPANCKALGREFFHIDGKIEFEADLYFSEGCMGYVFMKNNKAIYANKVSPSGQQFYGNLIAQATKIATQGNGG